MQAAIAWKKLFTIKHLNERYFSRIKPHPSVGLDKVTTVNFEDNLYENIQIILRKSSNMTYRFTRYKMRLFIKGPQKPPREICIPTIRDKLVLSVLNELICAVYGNKCKTEMPQVIIDSILNALCHFDSFIKIDVKSFYASIPHEPLLHKVKSKIIKAEPRFLIQNAIETSSLYTPIKEKSPLTKRTKGIPEGLPISNSLANLYLSELDDKYHSNSSIRYFRYVDDILILAKHDEVTEIHSAITADLQKLGLNTNEKVDSGSITKGFEYLGYFICSKGATVRTRSRFKLEHDLEEMLGQFKNKSAEFIEWKLNLKITGFIFGTNKYGWLFFYSQITDTNLLFQLDNLVSKLLKRYGLFNKISCKRFVRTYHEIQHALHTSSYIPNFNNYDIFKKRGIVSYVYEKDYSEAAESLIEDLFNAIIHKEIRNFEKDIQGFS